MAATIPPTHDSPTSPDDQLRALEAMALFLEQQTAETLDLRAHIERALDPIEAAGRERSHLAARAALRGALAVVTSHAVPIPLSVLNSARTATDQP